MSTEWNEVQEEFARHKSYKLHKELFNMKGQYSDVHRTNFSRSYVPSTAKKTRQAWRYIRKKRCAKSTVALRYIWWDYLLCTKKRRILFDSQAKFWIFRPPMALWSQTRKGLHQVAWRSSMSTSGGWFTVGKTMQWARLFFFVAVRRNSQTVKRYESNRMQHGELRHRGSSYQAESCTIHWILASRRKPQGRKRNGGHHVGSVRAFHGWIQRIR